jgi:feruloyl esterase
VSSIFNATWDSLTALENWVEKGTAPSAQVTTDRRRAGPHAPLCDYPKWPQYKGAGDVNLARRSAA